MFLSFGHLRTCWGRYQAYVQTCFTLSCLPHVNNPAVFSCSTQVLEDILCDQRPTSGPLDIVASGGDWYHGVPRGTSGLVLAMVPSTNTGISPGTLSMGTRVLCSTEHRMVPSPREGSGWWWGLWLITGVLPSCHVSSFLTPDWACLGSCFFPFFTTGSGLPS